MFDNYFIFLRTFLKNELIYKYKIKNKQNNREKWIVIYNDVSLLRLKKIPFSNLRIKKLRNCM